MNTCMLEGVQACSDADLVALCREGDRDSFSVIVERYQNLLCGLAYSLCGDVGRSEDLAQEAFVLAWRKLSELESPDRLKPWLCAILRNLGRNSARAAIRDPLAAADPLLDDVAGRSEQAPTEAAISNEEQALMWTVLQGLPEIYREPLVLYYRSGDSATEVAEALDLSEEAVRQRLARGRALLGQRITRLVESGLRGSAPGKTFAAGVITVLAAASTSSASEMTTGTIVGGGAGASVKNAGIIAKVSAVTVNLGSVGAGLVALAGYVLNTRSVPERRFIAVSAVGIAVLGIALAGAMAGVYAYFRSGREWSDALLLCLAWLGFCGPLDAYACWIALRQKQIRTRDKEHPDFPAEGARRGYRLSIYGGMLSMALGAFTWPAYVAAAAQDRFGLSLLLVFAVGPAVLCAAYAVRRPKACANSFVALLWLLTGAAVLVVGARWEIWTAAEHLHLGTAGPVLLLIAVVAGSVRGGWFLKQRLLKSANVKRDSLVALTVWGLLILGGTRAIRSTAAWEGLEIEDVQLLLNTVQPDGTVSFRSVHNVVNGSAEEMRELQFVSSEPLNALLDSRGRTIPFTVQRDGKTLRFVGSLPEPIPPGGSLQITATGEMRDKVKALPGGLYELRQQHWPANGLRTLRVERYRLPTGWRLESASLPQTTTGWSRDGRLEVWVRKLIPAYGNIQFSLRFSRP